MMCVNIGFRNIAQSNVNSTSSTSMIELMEWKMAEEKYNVEK